MLIKEYIFESIILEDKIDFLVDQQGDKIMSAYENDTGQKPEGLDARGVILSLLKVDPSKKSLQWLVNRYKEQDFKLEDLSRIKEVLDQFNQKKSSLDKKDINQYKNWIELRDAVEEKKEVPLSNKQLDKKIKQEGSEVIAKGPDAVVIKLKTEEAACLYGRGTEWCTAYTDDDKENRFDYYNKSGTLYVVIGKDGRKYQLHFEDKEYMDENDRPVKIKDLMDKYPTMVTFIDKIFDKEEISKDAKKSYQYAKDILEGRFELGEKAIATNDYCSYWYALDVLGGRFELGEKAIATNAKYSYQYAKDVLEAMFVLGEKAIATDAHYSYCYARWVLDERFELGEEAIAIDAGLSYLYAKEILEGPFGLGEKAIATNAYYSHAYAVDVLNGRFELGEMEIIQDGTYYKQYESYLRTNHPKQHEEFTNWIELL